MARAFQFLLLKRVDIATQMSFSFAFILESYEVVKIPFFTNYEMLDYLHGRILLRCLHIHDEICQILQVHLLELFI